MLAQPGREGEGGGGGVGRTEAPGNSPCLLAPASMAKGGWKTGASGSPRRPSLVTLRNQASHSVSVSLPCKMPHGPLRPPPRSGLQATTSRCCTEPTLP